MTSSIEHATSLINPAYRHVLEFGVFEGRTIRLIKARLGNSADIFGFDSFEGLPEDWKNTPCKKGCFTTYGEIPAVDGVVFFKGLFKDTIPEYLRIAAPIALLHVDCDLYSSTKDVLGMLGQHIKRGTIIVFDEWIYNSDPNCNDHEQRAFLEWASTEARAFDVVDFDDQTTCGCERKIVRITH